MTESTSPHPEEAHRSNRSNWLRAGVLGVNDGLVSTSSIMLGLAAANADYKIILTTGIASLFAGAFSMAAGEYVSVASQKDAQRADIEIEKRALINDPEGELAELAGIYEARGLKPALAMQVAVELHKTDAVEAHARDELGITSHAKANPLQASTTSALAFAIGSSVPILAAIYANTLLGGDNILFIVIVSLVALAISGMVGAFIGGGSRLIAALRVFIGGGIAMAVTYLIGHLVGINL
ncbi:VIT family protein [Candidatus Saccharibacteria bacterium]|nr:VIT family protein [Candidatus Saccharibacteria bacterium]